MTPAKSFAPGKLRILIIDDDANIRSSLRCYLEDHGFGVTAVESGEDAIQAALLSAFDFAIVDVRLPKMDGGEVIVNLNKQQPHLRFLIYTGSVEYKLTAELSRLGTQQELVFQKPVSDMKIFVEAMKQLWSETT